MVEEKCLAPLLGKDLGEISLLFQQSFPVERGERLPHHVRQRLYQAKVFKIQMLDGCSNFIILQLLGNIHDFCLVKEALRERKKEPEKSGFSVIYDLLEWKGNVDGFLELISQFHLVSHSDIQKALFISHIQSETLRSIMKANAEQDLTDIINQSLFLFSSGELALL